MKASLRDIRDGIINSQSPYQQQAGLFSHLLSPERKKDWHRINMEHSLSIQNQSLNNIEQYIHYGVVSNARNLHKISQNISDLNTNISLGFENIANNLKKTNDLLNNSNQILKGILDALLSPETSKAKEKANLASLNIKNALNLKSERAKILLDEAEILLKESIDISPFDYRAHFDLGYLYSFYRLDFKNAENCFNNAVLRALGNDNEFAAYSLRHLADSRKNLGNLKNALIAIQEAFEINNENSQIQFEYAEYLILDNQIKNASNIIHKLINGNPEYYDISLTNPIFVGNEEILECLELIRDEKEDDFVFDLDEEYEKYYKSNYIHTTLRNFWGKQKKSYTNIKLNESDLDNIKNKIFREYVDYNKGLTFKELCNKEYTTIKSHLNSFLQKELNSMLLRKNKNAFGAEIYLGKY